MQNRHIIQKQFIEVEMENPPDAFAFRNRLGELYYERVLPGLEEVFDAIGTKQKLIRKDFLDVDLGIIDKKNWEEIFVDMAIAKIKESLIMENGVSINEERETSKRSFLHKKVESEHNATHSIEEIFLFFLRHGYLPWYVHGQFDLRNEMENWVQQNPSSVKKFFENPVKAEKKMLLRLIYRFDETLLKSLLVAALDQEFLQEIWRHEEELKLFLHEISPGATKRLFFYPLLKLLFSKQEKPVDFYITVLTNEIQNEHPSVGVATILQNIRLTIEQDRADGSAGLLAAINKLSSVDLFSKAKEIESTASSKQDKVIEGNYIKNAGLVLLHPFLRLFFDQLGLMEEENFKDEAARQKAVLLSQYLVTGETEINEEDILLNKIICGYPLEDSLPHELDLSEFEINETKELLAHIAESWKIHGVPVNNSIEGLRESFLQRNGKLTQGEDDWKLQVEQKAFDMVLSSLPWNISIIKNSWMKGMLWVEWA